jgi:hypothetical protein
LRHYDVSASVVDEQTIRRAPLSFARPHNSRAFLSSAAWATSRFSARFKVVLKLARPQNAALATALCVSSS